MQRKPWGLKWRSSIWFTTLVVGFGIATDMLVYSTVIPVFPFRLERLGYSNVSSLVGWLLFAYSGGLVFFTIPIAMLSERYDSRRMPLIIGLVALLVSQIMLMESPFYWLMCLARVLQGISSSVVWVVGLALLADNVPKKIIGTQLGFAMMGLSLGLVVGPPVGGALYSRIGFRAPFIFGEICTLIDLLGRFLIIERKDAIPWDTDSTDGPIASSCSQESLLTTSQDNRTIDETATENTPLLQSSERICATDRNSIKSVDDDGGGRGGGYTRSSTLSTIPSSSSFENEVAKPQPLALTAVVLKLAKSPRALVALIITFAYGVTYTSQEPALPVRLQDVYGFDSWKVGLVFLAAVVPTIFSAPLSGWFADNNGTEWVATLCIGCALPWWIVISMRLPLWLFVTAFATESFFSSGLNSLVSAELAAVSRNNEGIGYAHTYGALNLAYGVGNAVGPIIGGQLYDHVKQGWMVLCLLSAGLLTVCLFLAFGYVGADPLLSRVLRRVRSRVRNT